MLSCGCLEMDSLKGTGASGQQEDGDGMIGQGSSGSKFWGADNIKLFGVCETTHSALWCTEGSAVPLNHRARLAL